MASNAPSANGMRVEWNGVCPGNAEAICRVEGEAADDDVLEAKYAEDALGKAFGLLRSGLFLLGRHRSAILGSNHGRVTGRGGRVGIMGRWRSSFPL